MAREAIRNYGAYWIFGPTKREAVDIYWNAISELEYINPISGKLEKRKGSLLDIAFPEEIRLRTNQSENFIELINGSIIKLGGTSEGRVVGITGKGFIITEYSLPDHHPDVMALIDPIISQSKGWVIINGTQRETDNQLNQLIESTKDDKKWYTTYQTMEDTKTGYFIDDLGDYSINPELEGIINPYTGEAYENLQDKIRISPHLKNKYIREYLNIPLEGGVQGYYEDMMQIAGGNPSAVYDHSKPVYTAWDIGYADATVILYFQLDVDGNPNIIDYDKYDHKPVTYGINLVKNKTFRYGRHFVPHDVGQTEKMNGLDILTQAKRDHSFEMTKLPYQKKKKEGIELTRALIPMTKFHESNCKELVRSLWAYHENPSTEQPCHNNNCRECGGASHAADAFRYLAIALKLKWVEPTLINRYHEVLGNRVTEYDRRYHYNNGEQIFAL